jgi:hypothetical protein
VSFYLSNQVSLGLVVWVFDVSNDRTLKYFVSLFTIIFRRYKDALIAPAIKLRFTVLLTNELMGFACEVFRWAGALSIFNRTAVVREPKHWAKEISEGDVAFITYCLPILHKTLELVSIQEHLFHVCRIRLNISIISHYGVKRVPKSRDLVVLEPIRLTVNP